MSRSTSSSLDPGQIVRLPGALVMKADVNLTSVRLSISAGCQGIQIQQGSINLARINKGAILALSGTLLAQIVVTQRSRHPPRIIQKIAGARTDALIIAVDIPIESISHLTQGLATVRATKAIAVAEYQVAGENGRGVGGQVDAIAIVSGVILCEGVVGQMGP